MYVDENNMQEEQKENNRKRNKALALIQNPLKQLKVAKVEEEAAKKHTEIIETKIKD